MSTRKKKSRSQQRSATVPHRSALLRYLAQRNEPLNETVLYRAFNLRDQPQRQELYERLQRMQADGQVLLDRRGRWALPARMDMVRGRVIGHPDGYGFLSSEQSGDLFLPANEMRKVLHGDRVLARIRGTDRRGRREAHIVEVIEHGNRTIVGKFVREKKLSYVVPDDTRISQDIYVPPEARGGARDGQIVVVELTRPPTARFQPVGRIIEVLGEHMAPGMEIEIAIRKHELPFQWSDAVTELLDSVPEKVTDKDTRGRVDLRNLALVTIDGEDARDFDDAVYCEETKGGGWRLWVSIADVSYYVRTGGALDVEAYRRGNSVYFPQQVVPMLPEPLSNGICSLKPDVDRLCFACEMEISAAGKIESYRFYEAVMRSRARLTYTSVAGVLADEPELTKTYAGLLQPLRSLYALFVALHGQREVRGSVELELPETQIFFDAARKIDRIEPRTRNIAHRLIEECMLAANVCAADLLAQSKAPGLFRVHDRPDPAKVEELRRFLQALGLSLGGGLMPGPEHYTEVVERAKSRADTKVIHTALLMSMSRANYAAENNGHFALAYDRYTHFTSPIRRYPDLYVHRVIKQILANRPFSVDENEIDRLGTAAEHCSMTERRADDATRDVIQWLKAEYMLDHIGGVYTGTVTNVTDFGVFVELQEVFVEGLIHITALGNDYFHYDPVRRRLTGERSGQGFGLGDSIQVRVARVDLEQARIDFERIDANLKRRGRRRGRKH